MAADFAQTCNMDERTNEEKLRDRIDGLEAKAAELQTALLALSRAYSDWPMNVSDDEERLITRLIRDAE